MQIEVVIVGAGLSGLSCAKTLQTKGISFIVLEAADAVGGRVRTDQVDGFLLDRGFQVFLSSYPEPKRWLDYDQLQLKSFASGARVRYRGKFYDLADPWRRPWTALASAFSPIGSIFDKLRIAQLRSISMAGSYADRMQDPEQSSIDYLRGLGFSEQMIDTFLRPFLGGIFLDSQLQTSSRMLTFVFRMFSTGEACLPATGMQAIPEQLASGIPAERLRLNTRVALVRPGQVVLASGETIQARHIVVAVDGVAANTLLSQQLTQPVKSSGRGVRCLYYAATQAPFRDPILVLNGDRTGPVNNLCVLTNVAPSYAPPGENLLSVTVLDEEQYSIERLDNAALESQVREQLVQWYGAQVNTWRHLRTMSIPYALPDQSPPALTPPARPVDLSEGIYVCGDHRDNASIEGAMISGRRAAEAILSLLDDRHH